MFVGLGAGKILGICVFTLVSYSLLRFTTSGASLPVNTETGERIPWIDVPVIGLLGAMGFTVALFVAEAAGGQASLKLGALASFAFLAIAVLIGKLLTSSRMHCAKLVPERDI